MTPETPDLGPYSLEAELGRGGMGRVFEARHRPTGAMRAVKVLERADLESIERFRREAVALARVGAGVVPVHDSGTSGGSFWYAMDLVPGGSLAARVASGPLPWREAARLVSSVARTLDRCHAAGLVHRDVKPENVLLDERGEPLLADFGCVRVADATRLTEAGTVLGTAAYMAPEQLDGGAVDARADVFALGVVLFELVAGKRPHVGRSPFELLRVVRARERPPLEGVPPELEALLDRVLDPRRDGRPTAAGFARALDEVLAGKGAEGAGTRRSSRAHAAAALGLSALAVVVALGVRRLRGSGAEDPEVRRGAERAADERAARERAAALAVLEGPGPARLAAVDRLAHDPGSAPLLSAAVTRHPGAAWLRRARLEQSTLAGTPLVGDDVVLAARTLDAAGLGVLVSVVARNPARLEDPGRLEALGLLRERALREPPVPPSLVLALALELLAHGRREETCALLGRDGSDATRPIREALDGASAFARVYAESPFFQPGPIKEAAQRLAPRLAVAAQRVAGPALGAIVAPITATLERIVTNRREEEDMRGEHLESFATLLEPIAPRLPDDVFATYECACFDRRLSLDGGDAVERERHRERRVRERLEAALPALRARDPRLAVEALLVLVDVASRFDTLDVAWARPWVTRLEELEPAVESRVARCRLALRAAQIEAQVAVAGPGAERAQGLARALRHWERARAHVAGRPESPPSALWIDGARIFFFLGRWSEAEPLLERIDKAAQTHLRAEVRRRQGDFAGAIQLGAELESTPRELRGGHSHDSLAGTLALAHAALGHEKEARARLNEIVGRSDDEALVLLDLSVAGVHAQVEELLRAAAAKAPGTGR